MDIYQILYGVKQRAESGRWHESQVSGMTKEQVSEWTCKSDCGFTFPPLMVQTNKKDQT